MPGSVDRTRADELTHELLNDHHTSDDPLEGRVRCRPDHNGGHPDERRCDVPRTAGAGQSRDRLVRDRTRLCDGATLRVSATDSAGTSTRYYRLRPFNDPRNVPVPFGEDSKWWKWPDDDEDGLPDHWETNGVWVKNKHLDLPGLGADPGHRDFFVHYDYQEGSQPSQGMFDEMKKAYATSPLSNPDGTTGVTLHVVLGGSVPSSIAGILYDAR